MSLEECIKRPLAVVERLFAEHVAAAAAAGAGGAAAAPAPDAAHAAVVAHFERVLASPAALQQVPVLNAATADSIPSGTLVRFRGMVRHSG